MAGPQAGVVGTSPPPPSITIQANMELDTKTTTEQQGVTTTPPSACWFGPHLFSSLPVPFLVKASHGYVCTCACGDWCACRVVVQHIQRGWEGPRVCVCSCISIFGGGVCVWCMWGCRCVRRCVSHIAQHTLAHQDKGTGGQYWSCGCTCTSVHVGVCVGMCMDVCACV